MNQPPPVWDGVLRRLGAEMPEFALEAWIRPLRVREDGDRLVLLAPSAFHQQRIRARYLPLLAGCAERERGRDVRVEVEVDAGAPVATGPASAKRLPAPPLPEQAVSSASQPSREPQQQILPHTFETFVVGPENALAREASLALAQGRQPGASPLLLVGTAGTGKSHLARALVSEARGRGATRALYASAESFTNALLASIRARETASFKRRFRDECELLVLEDIQFLEGKSATQLELFHTIEHLRLVGRPVVLTGDRLPRDIPRLDPRLSSQMTSGLVAVLEPPDASLRREILRVKASRGGVRIPAVCLDRLVDSVRGSVRDLEGVLIQIVVSASLLDRPIDMALTEEALRKVAPQDEKPGLGPEQVVACVAAFFGLTPQELGSRSKRQPVLVPRQLAMYLCHRFTEASLAEIGRSLGRDRPAVRNAIAKMERAILERAPLRYQVEALVRRLEQRRRGEELRPPAGAPRRGGRAARVPRASGAGR
jgi:chromosomal replication initiator protein